MNILELFAHIGLKADTEPADRFLKGIKGISNELKGAILGTLSLATAIKSVNAAMGDAMQLKKFSAETGASTDSLQKWRAVADQVSGSGQAVSDSIKAIVSNQEKIKLGQGNISGYQLLGIDPRQDPFVVMQQVADKTRNLSAGMRRNIMSQFGISTELTATLELTNKQFDSMAKRVWVIPPSMIDGMNRARASMEQVKNATMYFTAELATKLGPAIEKISKFLVNFVGFIIHGVENISKLIQNTIGWRTALIALVAVLAAMNAEFLLSPIGIFTAAIILLMAVLQDLAVYNSGKGKSLFGFLMEKFPNLSKIVQPFKDLAEVLKDAIDGIKWIFTTVGSLIDFLNGKRVDWAAIFGFGPDGLFGKANKIGDAILKLVGAGDLTTANVTAFNKANGFATDDALHDMILPWIQKTFGGGQAAAGADANVSVNISGVSDPVEAGKRAAAEVQRVLSTTQIQGARGKKEMP